MAYSIFENNSEVPSTSEIRAALGEAHALWLKLKDTVAAQHEPCDQEWVYGGKNYGWSLRLKRKKRAILYLTPAHECFRVGFALGEKAVQAAHEAGLSKGVLKVIDEAPKYVEGRAVRLEIRTAAELADMVKLAGIKMAELRVATARQSAQGRPIGADEAVAAGPPEFRWIGAASVAFGNAVDRCHA